MLKRMNKAFSIRVIVVKKRFLKFIIGLCVLSVLASCVSCKKSNPKPMLKVITSYQVGVVDLVSRQYYVVYDNGKKERTKSFEFTTKFDTLGHSFVLDAEEKMTPYLYGIDINTEEDSTLNEIAKKIISLTENDKKASALDRLFVIEKTYNEKRYYFISRTDGFLNNVNDSLFEYYPESNSYKKIALFDNRIEIVQAYE